MLAIKRGRLVLGLGLVCACTLAFAPSAFADTVNLTRFSPTVSGTADAGVTGVTVDLLRNVIGTDGTVARTQVDSFSATPDGSGNWSGSFPTHAFSNGGDQVEVNYTGASGANEVPQVTIGGGRFLNSAFAPGSGGNAGNEEFFLPADSLDGGFDIPSDGSSINYDNCCASFGYQQFSATVNGNSVGNDGGSGTIPLSTPVGNGDTVVLTAQYTHQFSPGGSTTVNLTDMAPLLDVQLSGDAALNPPAPSEYTKNEPTCSAYLVTNEVICNNLDPGSYTLSFNGASQTISTPSPTWNTGFNPDLVPQEAGATVPNLGAGGKVTLVTGSHTLVTLTVHPFTFTSTTPFGDLLNGSNTTITATCAAGLFLNSGDVCGQNGQLPQPNNAPNGFFFGGFLGQVDETSSGQTQIDFPTIAAQTPNFGESIHTPFQAWGIARYTDQVALANAANSQTFVGQRPVVPSTPSPAVVTLSTAPLGSSSFTSVGNANQAGGVALPTLQPGPYDAQWSVADGRGDNVTYHSLFFDQGNATGPAGVSPQGPPAPKCSGKGAHITSAGRRGTINATVSRKKKKAKRIPKVTLTCHSSVSGARVALWAIRGKNVVADGSGVVKHGHARITLSPVKKGTYQLVEVIDSKGLATEVIHIMKVK